MGDYDSVFIFDMYRRLAHELGAKLLRNDCVSRGIYPGDRLAARAIDLPVPLEQNTTDAQYKGLLNDGYEYK
jgi:hypothetical protein